MEEYLMENRLIVDGTRIANEVKENLKVRVKQLKQVGIIPCLATILVGNDPASETYVQMKRNVCNKIGMTSKKIHLSKETTTEELLEVIEQLNQDKGVHGILLQHPVPGQIDERKCFDAICIKKDVDGVTSLGYGKTALGFGVYPACTAVAVLTILDYYGIHAKGKHAVVVGRSPILGKPVSAVLLNRNATVTTCHSYTKNIAEIVRLADIVVAAVGKPKFIQGDWLKLGAIVLDAGYNKGNIGDIDYETCLQKAFVITPVPGGIGPVTIAMLIKHTVEAAEKSMTL
jgi:methylenetetrahydrofolate dehydrogenase (NADP+)/methenyltetrahydrofolate cyclohydrolase